MAAVKIEMTDLDVLGRAGIMPGAAVYPLKVRDSRWQPTYRVMIAGVRAVQLIVLLRPLMRHRRQAQNDAALAARRSALAGRVQRSRLPARTRQEVAKRFRAGERAAELAEEFGIAREHVYKIVKSVEKMNLTEIRLP
jgi:hypothetical protein